MTYGRHNRNRKLTPDQVRYIRDHAYRELKARDPESEYMTHEELAYFFGVHKSTIDRIVSFQTYREIK